MQDNDFFGERSLLTEDPVNATVSATGYCDLLLLSASSYFDLVEEHPEFGRTLILCSGAHQHVQRKSYDGEASGSGGGSGGCAAAGRSGTASEWVVRRGLGRMRDRLSNALRPPSLEDSDDHSTRSWRGGRTARGRDNAYTV